MEYIELSSNRNNNAITDYAYIIATRTVINQVAEDEGLTAQQVNFLIAAYIISMSDSEIFSFARCGELLGITSANAYMNGRELVGGNYMARVDVGKRNYITTKGKNLVKQITRKIRRQAKQITGS